MITLPDGTPIAKEQYQLLSPCTTKIPNTYETTQDYVQYLLHSIPMLFVDSLFLYQLPKGLTIYGNHNVFSFTTGRKGDHLDTYVLSKPVNVVGLDIKSNYDILLATAVKQKHPAVFNNPEDLMKYICSFGYQGYLTPSAQELCLCSSEYVVLSKK